MIDGKVIIDNTIFLSKIYVGTGQLITLTGTSKFQQNAAPTVGIDLINKTYADTTYGLLTNPLSQFAVTTSSQLAGIISDETGSGNLVFGTSPTFTTQITTPKIVGVSNNLDINSNTIRQIGVNDTPQLLLLNSGTAGRLGIGVSGASSEITTFKGFLSTSTFLWATNSNQAQTTQTYIMQLFSTGNLLLQNGGTFTDNGYRLDVIGTSKFTAAVTASSALARATYINPTLTASANNDVLVSLDIASTFTNGAFTGVTNLDVRVQGNVSIGNYATPGTQRLVTIGQDTAWLTIGSVPGATNYIGMWVNNVTPSVSNAMLYAVAGATSIQGAGNLYLRSGGGNIISIAGGNITYALLNSTASTASIEVSGFLYNSYSRQWSTGNITIQREQYVKTVTYSAVGASTITSAYGLYIEAPTASTNITITNNYALGGNGSINFTDGTNSLNFLLTTNSVLSNTGATSGQNKVVSGTRSISMTSYSADTNYLDSTGATLRIRTLDSSAISFYTNNVNRMSISGADGSLLTPSFSTGAQFGFSFVPGSNTNQTAATEISGILFNAYSRQWAAGTVSTQREFYVKSVTYTAVAASTISNSYGMYVEAPTASTNMTITNNYALGLSGNLNVSGQSYFGQTTGTALVDIAASTTAAASLRLRSGVAPTTPNLGDLWYDGTSLKIKLATANSIITGGVSANAGVISFGTGVLDTITTSTQFTYTPTPTGSTLANTANLANISTLPSGTSAQSQWVGFYNGVTVPATPSASSNYSGFYNDVITSGGLSVNSLAAGVNFMRVGSSATTLKYRFSAGLNPNAAIGVQSASFGPSTTGVNFGIYGSAYGSATANIGTLGLASAASGSGANYGVMGIASATSGVGNAAGYFSLSLSDPTNDSAAIIVDNGVANVPIMIGRINGVIKMSIDALGKIKTLASTTSSAAINITSGVTPTVPNQGDIWNDGTSLVQQAGSKIINATGGILLNAGGTSNYLTIQGATANNTNYANISFISGTTTTANMPYISAQNAGNAIEMFAGGAKAYIDGTNGYRYYAQASGGVIPFMVDANRRTRIDINNTTFAPTNSAHLTVGAAGNASITALVIEQSTLNAVPSVTPSGGMYNEGGRLWFMEGSTLNKALVGAIYTHTADKTVANSVVETTLLNSTVTLPANTLNIGKTIRLYLSGFHSASGSPTIQVKVKLGSTVILDTTAVSSGNSTNATIIVDATITCRTTGATGTVYAQGLYRELGGGSNFFPMTNLAATTIDTTISQVLDITVAWGTASAGNTITATNAIIEIIK